jgi:hypothetical protein
MNPGERCIMKYFKILPAAAGVIALTATVAFARDQREAEEGYFLRIKVAACDLTHNVDTASINLLPEATDRESGHIYLVEVAHGDKRRMLSIDAYTGKILGNHEIPV